MSMDKKQYDREAHAELSKTISSMLEMSSFVVHGLPKPNEIRINLIMPKGWKLHHIATHAINSRGWEFVFLRGKIPENHAVFLAKKVDDSRNKTDSSVRLNKEDWKALKDGDG